MIIAIVVLLCPFRSWLTFIFGTKMAGVTLDTLHLQNFRNVNIKLRDGNLHMVPFCHI